MQALGTARMLRLLPAAAVKPTTVTPLSAMGCLTQKRGAGVGVLSAGIAINGVGLSALGLGILFHGLVSGVARNPALKEDLMVYAMIGVGMVEFFAIVILMFSGLLLYTE